MKRVLLVPALLALCAAIFVTRSFAAPITLTFTGTGSGSLTGIGPDAVFTDAAFIVTALADTNNRESFASGHFVTNDSASIWIEGVGTLSFLVETSSFFNDNQDLPGFSRTEGDLVYGPVSAALDGWDLLSSIGPIGGNVLLLQWPVAGVPTDGGQLVFANGFSAGTFSAVVGAGPSVPDATTTVFLIGSAFGAFVGFRRRFSAA